MQVEHIQVRKRGRRSVEQAGETREKILDTAQRKFGELGYSKASNTIIAEAAGIVPSSLYNHFKSKAELYTALCLRAEEALYNDHAVVISGAATSADALIGIIDTHLAKYQQDPSMQNFLAKISIEGIQNTDLALPLAEHMNDRLQGQLVTLIKAGQASGEISRSVNADSFAQMYIATLMGLALSALRHGADSYRDTLDAYKCLLKGSIFL